MIILLNITDVSAQTSVCCEKTLGDNPAWCQNSQASECDSTYRQTPTSCDATSFCKMGCCYDAKQGICMQDTSQRVCDESGGTWSEGRGCEIPQCTAGCCVLGEQTAFVTLTRCKKLSSFFGINTDFRGEITDEDSCILLANSQEKGACLFVSEESERTCSFGTRGECRDSGGEFHKDYLCSSEELGTDCGPSTKTTCVDGKDEVYFLDTCGNVANIYDADKVNDKDYWDMIVTKEDSCSSTNNNCGNCDYFSGSMCGGYRAGKDGTKPSYGDNVCRSLDCKNIGRKHGESWCDNTGVEDNGKAAAGSRSFRHICFFGEETVEACEDYRKEICYEESSGGILQAACRINDYYDCFDQTRKTDCENSDKRDCYWSYNYRYIGATEVPEKTEEPSAISNVGQYIGIYSAKKFDEEEIYEGIKKRTQSDLNKYPIADFPDLGICLPKYPPGFDLGGIEQADYTRTSKGQQEEKFPSSSGTAFSGSRSSSVNGEGSSECSLGDAKCKVVYEAKGIGAVLGKLTGNENWKCIENCECLQDDWATKINSVCTSFGDCGAYKNYIGKITYDGYEWTYSEFDSDYGDYRKQKKISQVLAGAVA